MPQSPNDEERQIWEGEKSEKLFIRMTREEKSDLKKVTNRLGGQSMSRYLLNLHHRTQGRL